MDDLTAAVESALLRVARNVAKHFVERPGDWSDDDRCFRVDLRESVAEVVAAVRPVHPAGAVGEAIRVLAETVAKGDGVPGDKPLCFRLHFNHTVECGLTLDHLRLLADQFKGESA